MIVFLREDHLNSSSIGLVIVEMTFHISLKIGDVEVWLQEL